MTDSARLAAARDHAALAATLDPIFTIDTHGIILSVSRSAQHVFGWTSDELIGRNVSVLMPEPHRSGHDSYLANYRLTGRTNILGRSREFEAVRKNGERFPVEISVSRVDPISPDEADMPLFVGIIRDITERKRLERELRLVQDLALAISTAPSLMDALVGAIRHICLATGWDYGEAWIPGKDGDLLIDGAYWIQPGSGLEKFAESMRHCTFRRGIGLVGKVWSTARPIWIGNLSEANETDLCCANAARGAGLRAAAAVPIPSEDRPVAALVFFTRHTGREDLHLLELACTAVAPLGALVQRRRVEDELDGYRRRLEERVEERTQELRESQDRLRIADRMASIGTLAAGLGHDMNNVLLPVRARLNALKAAGEAAKLAAPEREHVEEIRKSIAYLQQLADGLHFLALDPDTKEDARGGGASTDLHLWWEQAGTLLSKAVPKHVRVAASFPAELPNVALAAHGLTQAVLNLVVNAGEAIPGPPERKRRQGHVRIWADAIEDPAGSWVRIGVTDNGTGMSEEVSRRAVEMFFTTKPRGLGTGLGLALVHRIVSRAGGRFEIESKLGIGTTVRIILPAARPLGSSPAGGERMSAVIALRDGRAAALIRHLLEAAGATVRADRNCSLADIVVCEPDDSELQASKTLREARPGSRWVLLGSPNRSHASAWKRFEPIVIADPSNVESIRAAVGRAINAPR